MAVSSGPLTSLLVSGVKETGVEIGVGAYGRVFEVDYCGTICAAKEVHSILLRDVNPGGSLRVKENFLRECQQCADLRHPNVVQFLGVYFRHGTPTPIMFMEKMNESLRKSLERQQKIPLTAKLCILEDVSLGLRYLHSHNPPIVHRDLSSNNILLTTFLRAKISDLGVAKVIRPDHKMSLTKIPGTVDFMPPEAMSDASSLEYGIALDVFSFGAVMLHVATQEWPRPLAIKMYDKQKRKPTALTEVERRQPYLDKVTGVTSDLKPLIISCLDDDPSERPSIIEVSENLKKTKKEHSSVSLTTLLDQANEQNKVLESQIVQQAKEIDQLKEEIDHLQNPFQYHNEVQQPDSSTVKNVTQVRSESPCGKSNSLPRREVCSGSPKLTRSKRIHEYEKVDKGINGFNMPQNVARLWQNESILKKFSPNVEVMVTEYASCKSFPRSMQPHHIHKYEDTDDHDSPPDTPSQCQTDLVQSPDIKKDNKLRPKAVLIRRHSSVECEKDLARAQANHWALVKKSSVLDMVKRLYNPLRKHGQKPGNQTTQFTATPPQHQSPKSNRKSDGTATPPKSPPRSNKTMSSLAETPPLPRKDGRHFEGCDEKQPLHDPILDRPPMPTPRSHNKL